MWMGTTRLGSQISLNLNRLGGGGGDSSSSSSFSPLSSGTTAHIVHLESSLSVSDVLHPPSSQWSSSCLLLFPAALAYAVYLRISLFFSFFSDFIVIIGSGTVTLTLRASAFFTGVGGSTAPYLDPKQEQNTVMPYIVPSTPSSSASFSTPPQSPSHPPIALSMALASPAPVPAHTPFTPPTLPTSPLVSSSAFNSQSFGSAARGMGYLYSSPHAPPLVKALSDSSTPTTASQSRPSSSNTSPTPPRSSPPMRRTASASSASPMPGVYRYANAAGGSLPRIPRRRGGCTTFLSEERSSASSDRTVAQAQSTPPRGRTRSRFVLGGEEESGSGNEEERRREKPRRTERNGKKTVEDVDERAARKRHISAERSTALKIVSPSLSSSQAPSMAGSSNDTELDFEHSESGSECATPTPSSMAHGYQARERVLQLQAAVQIQEPSSAGGQSGIPGVAPRARRGRGREGARRLFEDDLQDEHAQQKDETSTVAFPSANPPSPPPSIAVAVPTPEITPFSSPGQDANCKGLSGKRTNAGSLRLEFSFGGLSAATKELGIDMESSLSADHGRTLSESASLSSGPLIRKKSGEVVRSSLKSRSSSASAARHRPSLSLGDIATLAMPSPSVSAPATPAASGKMVHFDTQLEHVKVFKSTSKPAAVSRNGSHTFDDTTSGGEGEGDSASEGGSLTDFVPRPRTRRLVPGGSTNEEEEAVRRVLMMRVLNMSQRMSEMNDADVRLEGLHLADDAASVQGIVRVQNFSFEKSVAVRFTFDGWQTTSEVIGRWAESCVPRNPAPFLSTPKSVSSPLAGMKTDVPPTPTFDRFSFSIRLTDMLLRIDEKTLVLAVRYCSAGREMWDNNGGQNYRAVFERRVQHSLTLAGSAVVPAGKEKGKSDETGRNAGAVGGASWGSTVADGGKVNSLGLSLHSALDKVVAGANSKTKDDDSLSPLKKPTDLASRYDLDVSLKNHSAWRPAFQQVQTWAGHGQGRDNVYSRTALPWSKIRYGSREGPGQSYMTSPEDFSKSRSFKSYNLSFNAHELPRGSPRDIDRETLDDSDVMRARFPASEDVNTPDGELFPRYHGGASSFISPPTGWASSTLEPHGRNHHRSYFDAWATAAVTSPGFGAGKVRLTPPGSPGSLSTYRTLSDSDADAVPTASSSRSVTPSAEHPSATSPVRHYSFPPLMCPGSGTAGLGLLTSRPWTDMPRSLGKDAGDSEASTPSVTSISSPTMTDSPSSPPDFSTLMPMVHTGSITYPEGASMDSNSYNAFLSSFCFYRGPDGQLDTAATEMRRTHSVSSIEELLSTPSPSSIEAFPLFKGPSQIPTAISTRATTPTLPTSNVSFSPNEMPPPPTSAGFLETESSMSARVHG